jgi:epoxide hydrolase
LTSKDEDRWWLLGHHGRDCRLASHQRLRQYGKDGSGYLQLRGTHPQTPTYGLTDSPAGQLALIAEQFK